MTNTKLDQLAQDFCDAEVALADQPNCPVALRWATILTRVPEMRRRKLHEDLTTIYQRAYEKAEGMELVWVHDLAALQVYFFHMLLANGMSRRHICDYWKTNAMVWEQKLRDRLNAHEFPRAEKGTWVKGSFEPVTHTWLN